MPSNRSRARILEQLTLAGAFGDAFLAMVQGSSLDITLIREGRPLQAPTITIGADTFLATWVAFLRWHGQQPHGDDLAPAVDPPSTTSVPPD